MANLKHIDSRVNKMVTTVNLTESMIRALDKLRANGLIKSRSEAIRQMLMYAFPYFLGLHKLIRIIGSDTFKFNPTLKNLEKIKETKMTNLQPNTLKQLRKLYPDSIDYKFINEE